jgi:hypothetical protein
MHQWFAISRADAEKFVTIRESRFLPLVALYEASMERPTEEVFKQANTKWLSNLDQYQKDAKEKKAYLNTLNFYKSLVVDRLKKNVLEIPSVCPDEYWPLILMKELKVQPEDDCTTGFWKPIKDMEKFGPMPSPITWYTPKDVYALKSNDPDSTSVSFEDAVKYSLKRLPHAEFFRKFHSTFPVEYNTWELNLA